MAYHMESLIKVIELILRNDHQLDAFTNKAIKQIKSLLEKACFLRDAFANHAILSQHEDNFEDQIRDATRDAEDVLETYCVKPGTSLQCLQKLLRRFPHPDLHKVLENLDSVKDEMMKILDGDQISANHRESPVVESSRIDHNPKNILVGITDDLLKLKGRVFGDSSKLEVIPIVGMGGIGKTTLARSIHDDPSVICHFDVCAWSTVSDDYRLSNILRELLRSMNKSSRGKTMTKSDRDEMTGEEHDTLGVTLHQSLMGRRYLIVMDDIWRSKAWDDVKKFFPNDNNGSRIILTTRDSTVATYVDLKSPHHQVRPLDKANSWELLRKKLFGEETCPPELEELGIEIATGCGGLPLAIQVIGGLLSQTERTESSWNKVAAEVISAVANGDEHVSSILSLSYDRLPYFLKPCFLYLSVFPEDYDIKASRIVKLWIGDGFEKTIHGKSLEEVAMEHINSLIDRNLIVVSGHSIRGEVKFLRMHDLLRALCVQKAEEKKFFHDYRRSYGKEILSESRRMNIPWGEDAKNIYHSATGKILVRSWICFECDDPFRYYYGSNEIGPIFSKLPLLRVLDMFLETFDPLPSTDIVHLANLRYLSLNSKKELPPGITACRNLQTLIFQNWRNSSKVSHEIFEMPHLREIVFTRCPFRCDFNKSKNLVLQQNLHTIVGLEISPNFDVFLAKRLPNLKKLGVHCTEKSDSKSVDLSCFQKLQTFKFTGEFTSKSYEFLMNVNEFPMLLKKLTVENATLTGGFMKTIGMLPNLEFLTLRTFKISPDNCWKPSQGEFSRLRFLVLMFVEFGDWEADETHFPILEYLKLQNCHSPKGIPLGIGEIPTLKTIEVIKSGKSVAASARKIQEEQLEMGIDLLQVHVVDE